MGKGTFDFSKMIGKPKPPPFKVGDKHHQLTIIEIMGHMCGPNGTQSRNRWWYRVQCDCGAIEEVSQHSLRTKKTACRKCLRAKAKRPEKVEYQETTLNFATLRWK